MILINNKSAENEVKIPKNYSDFNTITSFTLTSKITNKTYPITINTQSQNLDYIRLSLDLSDMANGEYKYNVNAGEETGWLRIGDLSYSATTYNNQTENIIYYDRG